MTFNDNFEKQADILNQRFYLLLEDFKKTFLLFKENERYQLNRNKLPQNISLVCFNTRNITLVMQ